MRGKAGDDGAVGMVVEAVGCHGVEVGYGVGGGSDVQPGVGAVAGVAAFGTIFYPVVGRETVVGGEGDRGGACKGYRRGGMVVDTQVVDIHRVAVACGVDHAECDEASCAAVAVQ